MNVTVVIRFITPGLLDLVQRYRCQCSGDLARYSRAYRMTVVELKKFASDCDLKFWGMADFSLNDKGQLFQLLKER